MPGGRDAFRNKRQGGGAWRCARVVSAAVGVHGGAQRPSCWHCKPGWSALGTHIHRGLGYLST